MDETVKQLQDQVKALTEQLDAKSKNFDAAAQQLKDSSQFIEDASILVSAIMKDPALKTQVQGAITGQPAVPAPVTTPPADDSKKDWKFDPVTGKEIGAAPAPVKDERVDSIDGERRMKIIEEVERRFKYDSMKPEDKKELRKNVGQWLRSYEMDVATIPVDRLEERLKDAYLHVGIEQSSAKSTQPTPVIESYFSDPGKLPGMSGGSPDASATQLTPTHKKWADKLDVSEDKVAAGLKELTETGMITYKPKEKQQVSSTPTPSGTPTPPASN